MKNYHFTSVGLIVIISFLLGYSLIPFLQIKNLAQHRQDFIDHKQMMVGQMIDHGQYQCCLKTPCTYCIEKTPKHGPGASCHCLTDVVTGHHPCGECIGEILEGHGNKHLVNYFPQALADELGQDHLSTLTSIIQSKYNN